MTYDASLALATRDLRMLYKPYATANDLPADTVNFGASWGTGWVDMGGTVGGIRFRYNATRAELKIDQSPTAILRPFTGETLEMVTALDEITDDNLLVATGQGAVATVAAGSGTRGHKELTIQGNPVDTHYSFGAECRAQDLEAFRIFFPYALPTGSPDVNLTAEQLAQIGLTVSSFPDPTSTILAKVRDIIAALP